MSVLKQTLFIYEEYTINYRFKPVSCNHICMQVPPGPGVILEQLLGWIYFHGDHGGRNITGVTIVITNNRLIQKLTNGYGHG